MYKILLLEDDMVLGETIVELFELNSFEVVWVKDGKLAFEEIYENHFDILLLDINVPYINGFDLLKDLRGNDILTPAIFITANIDIASLKKGFDVGADDYIKKPFDFDELLIRIEALLKKVNPKTIVYNDLVYDTKSKVILKNNKIIHLTPSELALFEYFILNQNKVLETFELLEITNSNEFKAEILRVWISKLKKLGLNIVNIRGVGYRCETV